MLTLAVILMVSFANLFKLLTGIFFLTTVTVVIPCSLHVVVSEFCEAILDRFKFNLIFNIIIFIFINIDYFLAL